MKNFTSPAAVVKRIAESTVRRLSLYLRFLEDFEARGQQTVSSDELAHQGGTTSAQVRKDLSFFGSFGKRGLGYSVPELATQLRTILGLGREWKVAVIGAGKIGSALVQYRGFRQRGFDVVAVYDNDPAVIGRRWNGLVVRDVREFATRDEPLPDIIVLAVPAEQAQSVADFVVRRGVKAILNFASAPLVVPDDVAVKSVNMAMELETLSYSLVNRDGE